MANALRSLRTLTLAHQLRAQFVCINFTNALHSHTYTCGLSCVSEQCTLSCSPAMRAGNIARIARMISGQTWLGCSINLQFTRLYSLAERPLLYREFIQQSLYHPEHGYFNKPKPPIRRLAEPINFNRILNQAEYKLVLSRIYKQLQVDWLTPAEVFAPWYGRALAHYMLECRKHTLHSATSQPLAIVEIGGGTGTLAASVLDYIADKEPITYSCMSYTTIEISSSLAKLQQEYVVQQRGHSQVWRCVKGDASQPQSWADVAATLPSQHSMQQHVFVLMMEVLDNLPHDRVVRPSADAPWQQVAVQQQLESQHRSSKAHQQQPPARYQEVLQPLQDPLIQRCLAALYPEQQQQQQGGGSAISGSGSTSSGSTMKSWFQHVLGLPDENSTPTDVWLPTRCMQLLEVLHGLLPSHILIAADFDALPDILVPGRNAPLVSGREGQGATVDHDTVLVPWGAADIFFPTDFDGLSTMYKAAARSGPEVYDAAAAAAAERKIGSTKQRRGSAAGGKSSGSSSAAGAVSCSHTSTADFMSAFAEAKQTRLLSGYNPLVQDWPNTRVFVGQSSNVDA